MGVVLYRKYRSKSFDEVVGQEHITKTLQEAIKKGRVAHAYLFTGPRGVGKTSVARILAHAVNDFPYNEETSYLDIIEIDAASNRRIDEIRELRDKVHIAPANAKYKVYIIDEVHMLTKEAFNALLKTLEEPPEHAIFILATTEAHKVPETIISRTQRFSFRPIREEAAVNHLKDIAKREKITLSHEAAKRIAEHGQGSFRDSLSLLDQLSAHNTTIDLIDVDRSLGLPPENLVAKLYSAYSSNNAGQIVELVDECKTSGFNPLQLAKKLGQKLREDILSSLNITSRQVHALKALSEVGVHNDQYLAVELALLETIETVSKTTNEVVAPKVISKAVEVNPKATATKDVKHELSADATHSNKAQPKERHKTNKENFSKMDKATWAEILKEAKTRHNTLYSVLRMATPVIDDKEIKLVFAFDFHSKRIMDRKNQEVLADIIKQVSGQNIKVRCVTDPSMRAEPEKTESTAETKTPQAISNIFGDVEMLE